MAAGVFYTRVGKVRVASNRRFVVVAERNGQTKDGQTAVVVKRSDSQSVAKQFAAKRPVDFAVIDSATGQEV